MKNIRNISPSSFIKPNMKLTINLNQQDKGVRFKRNLFIKRKDIELMDLLKKRGILEEVTIAYPKKPKSIPKKIDFPISNRNKNNSVIFRKLLLSNSPNENGNGTKFQKIGENFNHKSIDYSVNLKYSRQSPIFDNQFIRRHYNNSKEKNNDAPLKNEDKERKNIRQMIYNLQPKKFQNIIHLNINNNYHNNSIYNNSNKKPKKLSQNLLNDNNIIHSQSFSTLIKSQSSRNLKQNTIFSSINLAKVQTSHDDHTLKSLNRSNLVTHKISDKNIKFLYFNNTPYNNNVNIHENNNSTQNDNNKGIQTFEEVEQTEKNCCIRRIKSKGIKYGYI